jgi:hypothetical protein
MKKRKTLDKHHEKEKERKIISERLMKRMK